MCCERQRQDQQSQQATCRSGVCKVGLGCFVTASAKPLWADMVLVVCMVRECDAVGASQDTTLWRPMATKIVEWLDVCKAKREK